MVARRTTKRTKKLRGFSFFEVILYLGLFATLATALLQFSWNTLDLGAKDHIERRVFSDARFVTERINYFIRNASGINAGASMLDDPDGKLVLEQLGSSNTVTIEIQGGKVVVTETGGSAVALQGADSIAGSLTFTEYGTGVDGSEYVDFTLILKSVNNDTSRVTYQATTTVRSGAFIRNSGTGL